MPQLALFPYEGLHPPIGRKKKGLITLIEFLLYYHLLVFYSVYLYCIFIMCDGSDTIVCNTYCYIYLAVIITLIFRMGIDNWFTYIAILVF